MKKIILFGAYGTLGTELRKLNPLIISPTKQEVDIRYEREVRDYIKLHNPDIVINAAAVIDNNTLENLPGNAIATNIIGSANIANVCIDVNIRYVYISTDYIYQGSKGNYSENDEILPFNFYSWTKLGGECSAKGVKNHLIIRTSFGQSYFPYKQAFSDKFTSKDYVDRIAPMILEASLSSIHGVLNLGTQRKTLFQYAWERNPNVVPVKISNTSFSSPVDTSLNLDKWNTFKSEKQSYLPHTKCRVCDSPNFIKYLDLGNLPLANNLEDSSILAKNKEKYPLQIMVCEQCSLNQLSVVVDPKVMFSNYCYRSSINKPYIEHCRKMAQDLKVAYNLNKDSFHIDLAGNDGALLKQFKEEIGLKVLNIDPATNLTKIAESEGIPSICDFWSAKLANTIVEKYGKADLISATNVFAHVSDIKDFILGAKLTLKDNGILVIECPYLDDIIRKFEYNQTYHEHLSYISVTPIYYLCKSLDMKLIDVKKVDIHGGTIRMTISKSDSKYEVSENVENYLSAEEAIEYTNPNTFIKWGKKVYQSIDYIKLALRDLKRDGYKIAAIAASAKGNTLLNVIGADSNLIDYIVDETPEKIGKYSPGTGIPIVSKENLKENPPDYLLILAENFKETLIQKAREVGYTGKFITPLPEFVIE